MPQLYGDLNNTPLYTIGITSKILKVCQETLRIWEKKGLIQPHRIGKNRFYSDCNIERLYRIKSLLREERINIAGVRSILNKLLCWEIKKCSLKERSSCPVYKRYMANQDYKNERGLSRGF